MKRAYDFVLYLLTALGALFATLWYAVAGNGDREFFGKWVRLGCMSLILFGYAVQRHRRMIRERWLWIVLLGAAAVHLSVFVLVLRSVSQWKVLWFVIPFPLENMAIDLAVSFVHQRLMVTRRPQRTD
jgi:hypothetical protein